MMNIQFQTVQSPEMNKSDKGKIHNSHQKQEVNNGKNSYIPE